MRSLRVSLLVAAHAAYALARHGHLAHAHQISHANILDTRDLDWMDAGRVPAELLVEVRTITTTVFEDCMPTNTVYTTTTVFIDVEEPRTTEELRTTSFSEMHRQTTNGSTSESTTIVHMTSTITKTVTDIIEVYAEPTSTSTPTRSSSIESSDGRTIPGTNVLDLIPSILPGLPDLLQLLPGPATHTGQPSLPSSLDWTSTPPNSDFSTNGFGARTPPNHTNIEYRGNVGVPWGSNIISVSPTSAHRYKYVAQFTGSNTEPWKVVIWNKVGPKGKMDGWYSHSALQFVLAPGEAWYVAFDEDSEGAWGAAPGTDGLPTDELGGYSSTWGEFTFGDLENGGWSGWDVSAIQAQLAHQPVQGMRICQADGEGCSVISPSAKKVVNAYTKTQRKHDGIGGAAPPGPVRLEVQVAYQD